MSDAVIQKIIDIEKKAQEIIKIAEETEATLDGAIEVEKKAIYERYQKQAEAEIETFRAAQENKQEEALKAQESEIEQAKAKLLKTYQAHHDAWLDELYQAVTGQV